MLDPNFVFLAAIINLAGTGSYALDTFRGRTKPNRVTWFLWGFIPLIIFFAQMSQDVGLSLVYTFIIAAGPLLVFSASFLNKQAYWKIGRFDIICGATAVLALILWLVSGDGMTAIVLSLLADFMAALPTIVKAYRFPETETPTAYFAGIISSVLTLLTISNWNFATYILPLYILVMCAVFYVLIKFPSLRPGPQLVSSQTEGASNV